jgi:Taurine catabolism dioxygenase TauD, TfdA family
MTTPAGSVSLTSAVATASIQGSSVEVHFAKHNVSSRYHALWLWSTDPAHVHPSSGQRLRSSITGFGWKPSRVDIVTNKDYQQAFAVSAQGDNIQTTDSKLNGHSEPSRLSSRLEQAHLQPPPYGSYHPMGGLYQLDGSLQSHTLPEDLSYRNWLKVTWVRHGEFASLSIASLGESNSTGGNESVVSFYDLDWLYQCRYDNIALQERMTAFQVTPDNAIRRDYQLTTISFDQLVNPDTSEQARYALLNAVVQDGAAMLSDCVRDSNRMPNGQYVVEYVGCLLSGGGVSHSQLYGAVFHVESVPKANNIAYTNVYLGPHQDLAYYHSKPGLQLLHCVKNAHVHGGASLLIDVMAAAYKLCELAPHLYQVLLTCEATFLKQRDKADMVYRRPHIEQDSQGCIVAVHYSPPFMGPVCLPADQMEDYFVAIGALERMLDTSLPKDQYMLPIDPTIERALIDYAHMYTWEQQLNRGDMLIFNNQRLLHGRRAFELMKSAQEGDGRHLMGCYTDMDDTWSQYRVLRRQGFQSPTDAGCLRSPGNGSSSVY